MPAKSGAGREHGEAIELTVSAVWSSTNADGETALVFRCLERGPIDLDGAPIAFVLPKGAIPELIRHLSNLAALPEEPAKPQ